MWADRPSPALPMVAMAAVVIGGIVLDFVDHRDRTGFFDDDPARLIYWVVSTLVAFVVLVVVARQQGYRYGIWINRNTLVLAGVLALAVVVLALTIRSGWLLPGDLTIRGNLPLLALTVGVLAWAARKRRPGLWIVGAVLIPLTLLANLYDMENLLFRLGIPSFPHDEQVVNLGVVAIVLLASAMIFAWSHRRDARHVARSR